MGHDALYRQSRDRQTTWHTFAQNLEGRGTWLDCLFEYRNSSQYSLGHCCWENDELCPTEWLEVVQIIRKWDDHAFEEWETVGTEGRDEEMKRRQW